MPTLRNSPATGRPGRGAPQEEPSPAAPRRRILIPLAVLLLLTLGCSAADLVQRATPTPVPTRTLAPTFTPTPGSLQGIVIVTPPAAGTPGVIIIPEGADPSAFIIPPPTETPIPTETPTFDPFASPLETPQPPAGGGPGTAEPGAPAQPLLPGQAATPTRTASPTSTPSPTPTQTATPFVVVQSGLTTLRSGPGVEYPLVAQLGPNIPITVVGRTPDGNWLQLCCVNGESVWVSTGSVQVMNSIEGVQLALAAGPPPPPTLTPTPTWTPTLTPTPTATPYPFEQAIGPQFFPTNNEFLTLWVKLFIGVEPTEVPAEGYYLKVLFEGFERPGTNGVQASRDEFDFSAPPGAGNRVEYNLKYEYMPPDPKTLDPNSTQTRADLLGSGTWTIYVTDGAGRQLSNAVTFTTAPGNANREVYIGWARIR